MKKLRLLLSFSLFVFSVTCIAQQGYDWGSNKPEAQGNWVFVNNHVKAKMFAEALPKVEWLLANTPNLHEDLYKQALKVYESLEKSEKDPARQIVLQDSVLSLYDTRIEKFGNEASTLNRKGLVAFKYLYERKTHLNELYNLYKKIFELNGDTAYSYHAYYYMLVTCDKSKAGDLTEDEVLATYFYLSDFLDAERTAAAGNDKKIALADKIQNQIDVSLERCVVMNCEKIVTIFDQKFAENPKDLALAKKIYRLSARAECNDAPLTTKALELINELEPSVGLSKSMAALYLSREQYNEAIGQYKRGVSLTSDPATKAELYLDLAKVYARLGQKSVSRDYATQCANTGFLTKEAYTHIGDLYFYSFEDCKSEDVLQTRAIYIAAYEMYQKANNGAKMSEAQKNFPSAEEIFTRNKEVGQSVNTGCWVNETVALRKR